MTALDYDDSPGASRADDLNGLREFPLSAEETDFTGYGLVYDVRIGWLLSIDHTYSPGQDRADGNDDLARCIQNPLTATALDQLSTPANLLNHARR